jgi:hypothetical protein
MVKFFTAVYDNTSQTSQGTRELNNLHTSADAVKEDICVKSWRKVCNMSLVWKVT